MILSKGKSIIIMGTGPSVAQCDFDPTNEIWGVNGTYCTVNVMPKKYQHLFRHDKLFLTDYMWGHDPDVGTLNFDVEMLNNFAEKYKCEIISLHRMALGKHKLKAKRYPYWDVVKFFGTDHFTDSVCYMIAYALYENSHLAESETGVIRPEVDYPLKLRLFGIDMATTREYAQSKGGVEHWLGIARGMGCEVEVAKGSTILSLPTGAPYGWYHRVKWDLKLIDPFGFMSGKDPSTAQMEEIMEKMRKK